MIVVRILLVLCMLALAPVIFALIHVLIALGLFSMLLAIIVLVLTGAFDEQMKG